MKSTRRFVPRDSFVSLFVGVTPGFEVPLKEELSGLGIRRIVRDDGGVECRAVDMKSIWSIVWKSRLAEGVKVRMSPDFVASNFSRLRQELKRQPFSEYLPSTKRRKEMQRLRAATATSPLQGSSADLPFAFPRVQVVTHHSKLYHSGAVEEMVNLRLREVLGLQKESIEEEEDEEEGDGKKKKKKEKKKDKKGAEAEDKPKETAVVETKKEESQQEKDSGDDDDPAKPRFFVRVVEDTVQVSADAVGGFLYKRGLKQHISGAPLRETIAAACLHVAGWRQDHFHPKGSQKGALQDVTSIFRQKKMIWDPFMGSGTIPMEALMIYMNLPAQSGASRKFLFEEWAKHSPDDYYAFIAKLQGINGTLAELPQRIVAIGSDKEERYVRAARFNFSNLTHWVQELQQATPSTKEGEQQQHPQHDHLAHFDAGAYCSLLRGDFEEVEPKVPQGAIIVTNLPYGIRSSPDAQALRATFERFGDMLKKRPDFREVYVINGSPLLQSATKLDWLELCRFRNRGLPASLLKLKRKDSGEA